MKVILSSFFLRTSISQIQRMRHGVQEFRNSYWHVERQMLTIEPSLKQSSIRALYVHSQMPCTHLILVQNFVNLRELA